jgi:hypothetical protein
MYEYTGILLGARPILHISRIMVKDISSEGNGSRHTSISPRFMKITEISVARTECKTSL